MCLFIKIKIQKFSFNMSVLNIDINVLKNANSLYSLLGAPQTQIDAYWLLRL